MKQTKWLISLSACLFLMAASSAGVKGKLAIPCQAWEQGSIDTIPLPSRIYSIGKEVDSIQSPSSLQSFFDELDSLGAGKDTVLTIVHLGDSHIQAGYYSGKVMRLLQAQFGNAGRGWIAPFKLSKTNEPDDYFISSSVREWVTGRCIQANKKCPVGIGGIGIQSVSPSINFINRDPVFTGRFHTDILGYGSGCRRCLGRYLPYFSSGRYVAAAQYPAETRHG